MNRKIAEYFKVLSDPNRMKIVELLLEGETCGCTLIDNLPITQPTLSYHLNYITKSGLAITKHEGHLIKYFIDRNKLNEMIDYLKKIRDIEVEQCNI